MEECDLVMDSRAKCEREKREKKIFWSRRRKSNEIEDRGRMRDSRHEHRKVGTERFGEKLQIKRRSFRFEHGKVFAFKISTCYVVKAVEAISLVVFRDFKWIEWQRIAFAWVHCKIKCKHHSELGYEFGWVIHDEWWQRQRLIEFQEWLWFHSWRMPIRVELCFALPISLSFYSIEIGLTNKRKKIKWLI